LGLCEGICAVFWIGRFAFRSQNCGPRRLSVIKVIYFFRREPGRSVESFQHYWRTTHAVLVRRIPRIRRYGQCHTLLSGYSRPSPPVFDGVEEVYFDSQEDLSLAEGTALYKAAMADLSNFVDTLRLKHIVTEEIEIKPGSVHESMVKNIELVTRKKGMPIVEFHSYWQCIHGPLAAKIGVIQRYVQSHTCMDEYKKKVPPPYDGVAETWFSDTASMRLSAATPEYHATRADERNFLTEPLPFIITRELRLMA
jgi:uncharacterized protein (TIGR02118 family)